jgi:hypothetical protein
VVLVAQRSHTTSFEDQTRVVRDVLADPAAGKGSQEVPVCDYQHIEGLRYAAFGFTDCVGVEAAADVGDDGVATGGDVGGRSGGWMLVVCYTSGTVVCESEKG